MTFLFQTNLGQPQPVSTTHFRSSRLPLETSACPDARSLSGTGNGAAVLPGENDHRDGKVLSEMSFGNIQAAEKANGTFETKETNPSG
jgi:hypothetical protein